MEENSKLKEELKFADYNTTKERHEKLVSLGIFKLLQILHVVIELFIETLTSTWKNLGGETRKLHHSCIVPIYFRVILRYNGIVLAIF